MRAVRFVGVGHSAQVTDAAKPAPGPGQVLIKIGGAIQSASCPFAIAVEAHPEVCCVAETLVAQITGERIRERCNKTDVPPRCSFEITEKRKR